MKTPKDCRNMRELRVEIDRIDAQLVQLLATRSLYIDRAAELKPSEGLPARIEDRVEEVVSKVRAEAQSQGLDADLCEALWRKLIDWSIAREETVLGPTPDGE
jgi:isochorismate pyruvate lyase